MQNTSARRTCAMFPHPFTFILLSVIIANSLTFSPQTPSESPKLILSNPSTATHSPPGSSTVPLLPLASNTSGAQLSASVIRNPSTSVTVRPTIITPHRTVSYISDSVSDDDSHHKSHIEDENNAGSDTQLLQKAEVLRASHRKVFINEDTKVIRTRQRFRTWKVVDSSNYLLSKSQQRSAVFRSNDAIWNQLTQEGDFSSRLLADNQTANQTYEQNAHSSFASKYISNHNREIIEKSNTTSGGPNYSKLLLNDSLNENYSPSAPISTLMNVQQISKTERSNSLIDGRTDIGVERKSDREKSSKGTSDVRAVNKESPHRVPFISLIPYYATRPNASRFGQRHIRASAVHVGQSTLDLQNARRNIREKRILSVPPAKQRNPVDKSALFYERAPGGMPPAPTPPEDFFDSKLSPLTATTTAIPEMSFDHLSVFTNSPILIGSGDGTVPYSTESSTSEPSTSTLKTETESNIRTSHAENIRLRITESTSGEPFKFTHSSTPSSPSDHHTISSIINTPRLSESLKPHNTLRPTNQLSTKSSSTGPFGLMKLSSNEDIPPRKLDSFAEQGVTVDFLLTSHPPYPPPFSTSHHETINFSIGTSSSEISSEFIKSRKRVQPPHDRQLYAEHRVPMAPSIPPADYESTTVSSFLRETTTNESPKTDELRPPKRTELNRGFPRPSIPASQLNEKFSLKLLPGKQVLPETYFLGEAVPSPPGHIPLDIPTASLADMSTTKPTPESVSKLVNIQKSQPTPPTPKAFAVSTASSTDRSQISSTPLFEVEKIRDKEWSKSTEKFDITFPSSKTTALPEEIRSTQFYPSTVLGSSQDLTNEDFFERSKSTVISSKTSPIVFHEEKTVRFSPRPSTRRPNLFITSVLPKTTATILQRLTLSTKPTTQFHQTSVGRLSTVKPFTTSMLSTKPVDSTKNVQTPFFFNKSNRTVPNRVRGKAHVICESDGVRFEVTTLLPFTGQVFAYDKKGVPGCVNMFTDAEFINVTLPYTDCGIRNADGSGSEAQYHVEVVVVFEQKDATTTMQSFTAQCIHQKIRYEHQDIPRRIEEALEELQLVPTKLEQRANLPEGRMRILTESDHSNNVDENDADTVEVGQPMRVEWSLVPESDAYGFHVRNCSIEDRISGERYLVIDERGCSTDINIFGHPHYDTYHDVARVHWHAFKVPDSSQLHIQCWFEICSDISDSATGMTSCNSIPSPPFCPDLITSPTNSILFDAEGKFVKKRHAKDEDIMHQQVHTDICFGKPTDEYCNSNNFTIDRQRHLKHSYVQSDHVCVSHFWLCALSGLSASTLLFAIAVNGYCRTKRLQRLKATNLFAATVEKSKKSDDT
ncbi:hypothetical protein AB6A40_000254 [Gnathostoma spinigerum]|uniref:ZP domain-containing protein n=1 Tax=Gnathostoma spinigerum TaxID=75299 RepID=A0ABD6EB66_9BILA